MQRVVIMVVLAMWCSQRVPGAVLTPPAQLAGHTIGPGEAPSTATEAPERPTQTSDRQDAPAIRLAPSWHPLPPTLVSPASLLSFPGPRHERVAGRYCWYHRCGTDRRLSTRVA